MMNLDFVFGYIITIFVIMITVMDDFFLLVYDLSINPNIDIWH